MMMIFLSLLCQMKQRWIEEKVMAKLISEDEEVEKKCKLTNFAHDSVFVNRC